MEEPKITDGKLQVYGKKYPLDDIKHVGVQESTYSWSWWAVTAGLTLLLVALSWFSTGDRWADKPLMGVLALVIIIVSIIILLRRMHSLSANAVTVVLDLGDQRKTLLKTRDHEAAFELKNEISRLL